MKKIIFEPTISGHVLEWIHHLYEYASSLSDDFVFILSSKFKVEKKHFFWESAKNIKIIYLTEKEEKNCTTDGLLRNAWNASWIIRKYVKEENASEVYLIFLMRLMPFLPFLLPKHTQTSGVLYRIYLYDKTKKGIRLFLEKIRYFIMAKSAKVKNIYVLNDEKGAQEFNHAYNTEKFIPLVDPLPVIKGPFHDLRAELNIPSRNTVFFQFGTIDERKNSLNILDSLFLLEDKTLESFTFIFSGRISPKIRNQFFQKIDLLKPKVQIIVFEGFLPYERINDLCYTSDCILTLYTNVCQSSGTIGYAAFFKKYIIGPSNGLLGNLIQDFHLGITIDEITPKTISAALCKKFEDTPKLYCETHSVSNFCETFLAQNNKTI